MPKKVERKKKDPAKPFEGDWKKKKKRINEYKEFSGRKKQGKQTQGQVNNNNFLFVSQEKEKMKVDKKEEEENRRKEIPVK